MSFVIKTKVVQNVNMSECNFFSLGIKMKIIQNVIIMSDGKKTSTDS